MPFEAYSAYFRPEELGVLAAAYDAAWQDLWTERLTLGAEQTLVQKEARANHSRFRVQRKTRRRPTERDCLARSIKAKGTSL
jgi:hypothetical protein